MKKEGKWYRKVVVLVVVVLLAEGCLFRVQAVTDAIKIEKEEVAICRIEVDEKADGHLQRSAAEVAEKEDRQSCMELFAETIQNYERQK